MTPTTLPEPWCWIVGIALIGLLVFLLMLLNRPDCYPHQWEPWEREDAVWQRRRCKRCGLIQREVTYR